MARGHCLQGEARQAPYPLEGTPDADVSELKVVNTYAPLWCTGATAGSRMMSTKVPRTCHTTEAAFQSARKRVGRKLISACSSRMTAQHAADSQTHRTLHNCKRPSDRAHIGLPGVARHLLDLRAPRADCLCWGLLPWELYWGAFLWTPEATSHQQRHHPT